MPFNVPEKEMLKKAISMKLHDIQEKYFQRKILDKVTYDKKISLLEDIVEKLGIQDVNVTTNEESVTRQRVVL